MIIIMMMNEICEIIISLVDKYQIIVKQNMPFLRKTYC